MLRFRCVLLLIIPAMAAAQQPGSAGAARPKLEVLQALPEAQLFPVMNLISTSMGVRCDYCHVQATPDLSRTPSNLGGWVWDRDGKQTKRRARPPDNRGGWGGGRGEKEDDAPPGGNNKEGVRSKRVGVGGQKKNRLLYVPARGNGCFPPPAAPPPGDWLGANGRSHDAAPR